MQSPRTTTPELERERAERGQAPPLPARRPRAARRIWAAIVNGWVRLAWKADRMLANRRAAIVALSTLLVLAALYHAAHAAQLRGFWIMTDELQYMKLALNIPDNPLPELHGKYFPSYNQLYPLLIAPLGALIESMPGFLIAVHLLNPLIMASVVFPTYLLTRSLVDSRLAAFAAAAISIAGPWLVFTSLVMTENAAYPAFMWALLGMQRALASPSAKGDLLALGGIALAAFARTQFVVLFPVFLLVIFLERASHETVHAPRDQEEAAFKRGLRIAAAEHLPLLVIAGVITLAAATVTATVSPDSVVGLYGTVFEKSLLPSGLLSHMVEHFATITVGFGVLPVALAGAFVVSALKNPVSRARHSFAVLTLAATIGVLFVSSSFNINFAASTLNDRYLFYVLPLLAVGAMVALVDRDVSWRSIVVVGAAVALLLPFGHYEGYEGSFWAGAPSSAIDRVLNGRLWQLNQYLPLKPSLELVLVGAGLAASGAAMLLARYRRGPVAVMTVALPVLLWNVTETVYQYDSQDPWQRPTPTVLRNSLDSGTFGTVDWIDKTVPSGSVALAPSVNVEQTLWWQDEFFNRRVDKVFRFVNPYQPKRFSTTLVHYQLETLFHDQIRIDPRTGAISGLPRERMTPYVVIAERDPRFGFAGARTLARHVDPSLDLDGGRRLLEVDVPYRAAFLVRPVLDEGWTIRKRTELLLFSRSPRPERWHVSLKLRSTGDVEGPRSWSVSMPATRRAGRLRPGEGKRTRFAVCVRPGAFPTRGHIEVGGRTRLPDGRRVGLLVTSVKATPTARSCQPSRRD